MLYLGIVMVVLITILVIITTIVNDKRKKTEAKIGRKLETYNGISINTYNKLYKRFYNNFLTRGKFRRIVESMSSLSVYSHKEVYVNSVKYYVLTIIIFIGMTITGLMMFKDFFARGLVILFAMVVQQGVVDKQIDKGKLKLLTDLWEALDGVQQAYLRYNTVTEAISESGATGSVKNAFDDIYVILTSPNQENKLSDFRRTTPIRMLQTLAGVCVLIDKTGDEYRENGTSVFMEALDMIGEEVGTEITNIHKQKAAFGLLGILPLIPVLLVGGAENFFRDIMPGTSLMYDGVWGYFSRFVILLASIFGYWFISTVTRDVSASRDIKINFIENLLKVKRVRSIVKTLIPKSGKKLRKKVTVIRESMAMIDLDYLYGFKIVSMLVSFVVLIVFSASIVKLSKDFAYKNVYDLSLFGGSELTSEDITKRKTMDKLFLATIPKMNPDDTLSFIQGYFPEIDELDKMGQVERLSKKYDTYYNSTYKWWYILLSFLGSLVMWNFPEFLLRIRRWLIKTETEEDVLQLQTIIAILSSTQIDTLDTLGWLTKQSKVHSELLKVAYHDYTSDPEMALAMAEAKTGSKNFKKILLKLKSTIYEIPMSEAFRNLRAERVQMQTLRAIQQDKTLANKRMWASPVSMLPTILLLLLHILVPIGLLGWREFSKVIASLG